LRSRYEDTQLERLFLEGKGPIFSSLSGTRQELRIAMMSRVEARLHCCYCVRSWSRWW